MNREIIEKMAKDTGCPFCQPCGECLLNKECDRIVFAERLYDKNYREQSEGVGEWKICSDGYYPYCSRCNHEPKNGVMSDFCPSCGARMSGGKNEQREAD